MKKIKVLFATALMVGAVGFAHASNDVPADNEKSNTNKTEATVNGEKMEKEKDDPKALFCKRTVRVEGGIVDKYTCWFCKCRE